METLTDVLKYLLTISPVREEADLSKGLKILEDGREKLDALVAKVEDKGDEVGQAIEVPETGAPKVAGL